jgi:hypothetical protein
MALTNHIVPDSPTNNFCTLNPLDNASVLSDGSLVTTGNNTWRGTNSTFKLPSTGKWYFESSTSVISQRTVLGFTTDSLSKTSTWQVTVGFVGLTVDQSSVNAQDNQSSYTNLWTKTTGSFGIQMVLQMCVDCATGNVWFGYNGNWYDSTGSATGNPSAGTNPTATLTTPTDWCPAIQSYDTNNDLIINFGQDPSFAGNKSPSTTYTDANGIGAFYYQPPTDALALCTANLPDFTPDVDDDVPQDYFKAVTYTGNGGTNDVDTGIAFDLLWLKNRDGSNSHLWVDSVRGKGVNGYKYINSNSTNDEYDGANIQEFLSIENGDSINGMRLASNAGSNGNNVNFIAWCWKAAGAPDQDYASANDGSAKIINEDGSANTSIQDCAALATAATNAGASNVITPSKVSANRQNGFSILEFSRIRASGQTVPHGLTSAPEFMILKEATTASTPWVVYHKNLSSAAYYLLLHDDIKEGSTNAYFNSTHPNSSVFTLGDASTLDTNVICYLWHSVEGYSKFGSYTGNGSADGTFVYCGFRPAFVMIKNTSSTGSWVIKDTSRDTYNPSGSTLLADTPDDDFGPGNTIIDILSNGWKCRSSSTYINTTNNNYIFMAFAEQPFKFSNAR